MPSPTDTPIPTAVPSGVFTLLFYPPLVMDYDPALWGDKSEYVDRSIMVNYLQAKDLSTCTIGVQGPTGFYGPHTTESITFGDISYTLLVLEDQLPEFQSAYYLEEQTLSGYEYEQYGLPVLGVGASPDEWERCKMLAEEVLGTLQVP
jgi:hypothetical protein